MKIMVTGASGFTATNIFPVLAADPANQLIVTCRVPIKNPTWRFCELSDINAVKCLLDEVQPQQIYHLAGSFSNDYETDYRDNVLATRNLIEGCLTLRLKCRILLVGSCAEYGMITESDNPVTESHLLNPVSIYGVTKAIQTHLMYYYHNVHNLDIVMARTFNLIGNNMSNRLFIGMLHEQIEKYKKGEIERIKLGSLECRRDYLPITEAVHCYLTIMNHGVAGEIYNVGSGTSVIIRELLESILKENDLSMNCVEIGLTSFTNKPDVPDIYANIAKLNRLREQYHKMPVCMPPDRDNSSSLVRCRH